MTCNQNCLQGRSCDCMQDAEELSADATSSLFLALLYIVGAVLAAAVILLPLFYGFPR